MIQRAPNGWPLIEDVNRKQYKGNRYAPSRSYHLISEKLFGHNIPGKKVGKPSHIKRRSMLKETNTKLHMARGESISAAMRYKKTLSKIK